MKKTKCLLAVLTAVSTSVLVPGAVRAAGLTLDWDSVDYTTGSLNESFNVGDGSVDFSYSFNGGTFVAGTPDDTIVLNGSSATNETLRLQYDPGNENDSVTMTTAFNYGVPVQNVSFRIYDIDISGSSASTSNSWNDLITVTGFLNGNPLTANYSGQGFTSGSVVQVGDSLNGVQNVGNDSDDGNIDVSFASPIDSFELVFSQDPALVRENPSSHGIGIGDISYEPVPEPLTIGGSLLAFGLGGYFKKKSAKKS